MTAEEVLQLLEDIHGGKVNPHNLPEGLYEKTADVLKTGLLEGFGGDIAILGDRDLELMEELTENIYHFSAAKTYQQVRDMTDALFDDEGQLRRWADFKEMADKIFGQYNENWLRAERDTAIASGQSGVRWNRIEAEKDTLPMLRMSVVEDQNTSEICAPLDGITLPVDDPFWSEYYPPNHYNCRSTVEQLEDGVAVSSKEVVASATKHADEDMDDSFKMNVGKDRVVFSDEHPYFEVEPKDRGFAADNFGLPWPDVGDDEGPGPVKNRSREEVIVRTAEALHWGNKQMEEARREWFGGRRRY